MKNLRDLCTPRQSVFDTARRDTVLDLTDLLEAKVDVPRFFTENYLTDGMRQLVTLGMRRLARKSEQVACMHL